MGGAGAWVTLASRLTRRLAGQAHLLVAPRYDGRAVAGMIDGHAQVMNTTGLQDMQHWANTADRPDFVLKP